MTGKCHTCGAAVDRYSAYCDECVAAQAEEQGDELGAFDAFHRWADAVLSPTREQADTQPAAPRFELTPLARLLLGVEDAA